MTVLFVCFIAFLLSFAQGDPDWVISNDLKSFPKIRVVENMDKWYGELRPRKTRGSDAEAMDALQQFFYNKTNGVAMELGAVDGQKLSETRTFSENLGWNRILVEANPTHRGALSNNSHTFAANVAICGVSTSQGTQGGESENTEGTNVSLRRSLCRELYTKHKVRPGVDWGTLSTAQQDEWMAQKCDEFYCQPHKLAGRGIYRCKPKIKSLPLLTIEPDTRGGDKYKDKDMVPKNPPSSPSPLTADSDSEDTGRVHFVQNRHMSGILEFFSPKYVKDMYPSLLPAVVLVPNNPNRISHFDWAVVKERGLFDYQVQEVACVPLSTVLATAGVTHVDFFVLDVEGAELDVLRTIDFSTVTINVIAVETEPLYRPADYSRQVALYLAQKGYVHIQGVPGRNSWFVRSGFESRPFQGARRNCFRGAIEASKMRQRDVGEYEQRCLE